MHVRSLDAGLNDAKSENQEGYREDGKIDRDLMSSALSGRRDARVILVN